MNLKEAVRVVPDFKGVNFVDITTLLQRWAIFSRSDKILGGKLCRQQSRPCGRTRVEGVRDRRSCGI